MIKNWSQSASSIYQTKQASQIRCRSNYLRALVVKFNEKRTEMLKFMLSQFKSKTQIYSKYIKHNWKYLDLHKYNTTRGVLNLSIIK